MLLLLPYSLPTIGPPRSDGLLQRIARLVSSFDIWSLSVSVIWIIERATECRKSQVSMQVRVLIYGAVKQQLLRFFSATPYCKMNIVILFNQMISGSIITTHQFRLHQTVRDSSLMTVTFSSATYSASRDC